MDVLSANDDQREQHEEFLHEPKNNFANMTDSSDSESQETSDQFSMEVENEIGSDEDDLRVDLQKSFPECYKSDQSYSSNSYSDITNEDELQASALCQFMDILNDLDEVLDKSLLACLDDGTKTLDSDEDDVICKIDLYNDNSYSTDEAPTTSIDDNTQVIVNIDTTSHEMESQYSERPRIFNLGRSKSFTSLVTHREAPCSLQVGTTNDDIRSSMRRLDPIVLPTMTAQEPLTLPVILFLEHHVNMRPTSAPIQLQVTTANLAADPSAPLIVGRRALLMNRALSLPSPGESIVTGDWQNTTRSTIRSTSASSSSSESLNGVPPSNPTTVPDDRNGEDQDTPYEVWPHRFSSMLACFSCTIGIFNISRFAMFSVHFGANFIVQFIILSLLIGIPLFTLHLCLGQVLKSGPVDMWRISPIFLGVGISLLIAQAVIGLYSIVAVSWLFIYFRDSFISTTDRYKWAMPLDLDEETTLKLNGTYKIQDTIPQYFHGEVLQRNLAYNASYFGTIKFQSAFNLAVVWMIIFVSLSKGLRSYGKTVYLLIFLPICGIVTLCIKLLTMIPYDSVTNLFSDTVWSEFFINSNSWAAAAQETFLTWGLLGACIMQLSSHKSAKSRTKMALQTDSACIVIVTFVVLLLAAFLANACVLVLKNNGYAYFPGSFENVKASQFLWPTGEPLPGNAGSTPVRYMGHYGSLVGTTVWRVGPAAHQLSGWQPLQLATQLVPATLAVVTPDMLSPAWAGIFYLVLITLGIAQQLAVWHCVVAGVVAASGALRAWETIITFLGCLLGMLLGLVLTTDAGIRVVHFVDYVWVGAWWQCLLHVCLACGVFAVRGRPYTGEVVVSALCGARGALAALAALLSFTWNVILPVALCAICVVDFRTGIQRQLYTWRRPAGYYQIWARQIAVLMQQGALLTVPAAAFVQTWRYMSKGPPDILDRIQNLYRPRLGASGETLAPRATTAGAGAAATAGPEGASAEAPLTVDPPPKYTPPPSYSTATGARLLHTLRRSFRTLRRMTTSRPDSTLSAESHAPITLSESVDQMPLTQPLPPDYGGLYSTPTITVTDELSPRPNASTSRRSLSLTRDMLRRSFVRKSDSAKSVRSSLRRSFRYGSALTTSHEELVRSAEPMSSTAAVSDNDWESAQSRASVI